MDIKFLLTVGILSSLTAGCGGGGGGSPAATITTAVPVVTTAPTPTLAVAGPVVPIELAIAGLYSVSRHFERTETDAKGNVYVGTADITVNADTLFERATAKRTDVRRNLTKNGVSLQASSESDFFLVSPYRVVGTQSNDTSLYIIASGQVPLPATGKPGDSGYFYDSTFYDSPAKNLVLATATNRWEIAADTPTSVLFCVNSVITFTQGAGNATKSECYQINTAGNVFGIGFKVPS